MVTNGGYLEKESYKEIETDWKHTTKINNSDLDFREAAVVSTLYSGWHMADIEQYILGGMDG